jgi:hypothetical protein
MLRPFHDVAGRTADRMSKPLIAPAAQATSPIIAW